MKEEKSSLELLKDSLRTSKIDSFEVEYDKAASKIAKEIQEKMDQQAFKVIVEALKNAKTK
jgi:hypothetical protein